MSAKKFRELSQAEIRLILFEDEPHDEERDHSGGELHACRETVNGNKVWACSWGATWNSVGLNYWSFPWLNFLVKHAPLCPICEDILLSEDLIERVEVPA